MADIISESNKVSTGINTKFFDMGDGTYAINLINVLTISSNGIDIISTNNATSIPVKYKDVGGGNYALAVYLV